MYLGDEAARRIPWLTASGHLEVPPPSVLVLSVGPFAHALKGISKISGPLPPPGHQCLGA